MSEPQMKNKEHVFGIESHEVVLMLSNIRLSAAAGRAYGHGPTPHSPSRIIERKDERFDQIIAFLARLGIEGSVLRELADPLSAREQGNALIDDDFGHVGLTPEDDAIAVVLNALNEVEESEVDDDLRETCRDALAAFEVIVKFIDGARRLLSARETTPQEQEKDLGAELIEANDTGHGDTLPRLTGMTLHQAAAMLAFLKAECEREHQRAEVAEAVIVAVKELAAKGYQHWDADEDSKAAKVLSALAGVSGCYPKLDALYAQVGSATVTANSGIAGPMSPAQKRVLSND